MSRVSRINPHRVATLSVHTSPLEQPGGGDAGGLNVYVLQVSRHLAEAGVAVDIFTRRTSPDLPPAVEVTPGVTVHHVTAGPPRPVAKDDLPALLRAFTEGMLRAQRGRDGGCYDVVHSHYWLSGQVGRMARQRWGVPLVHTAHTLALVKNAQLALGDRMEPPRRIRGEGDVVADSDRLVASTRAEAGHLIDLYGAEPERVAVIPPGVDLERFRLGSASAARTRLGIPPDAVVLLFVGRIQPLKAPDVVLRAAAELLAAEPWLADRLMICVVGAPSGSGLAAPHDLPTLASELGIAPMVRFLPPMPPEELAHVYQAADVTVVPSYSESFGLVALESQACGTPVVAASVGGLPTAVVDGTTGVLVEGHDPLHYAKVLGELLRHPTRLRELGEACRGHAEQFSWRSTAQQLLATYRQVLGSGWHCGPARAAL